MSKSDMMFLLWVIRKDGTEFPLCTIDGKPLSEKDADTIASKWDPSRRPVPRPVHYKTRNPAPAYFWVKWGKEGKNLQV